MKALVNRKIVKSQLCRKSAIGNKHAASVTLSERADSGREIQIKTEQERTNERPSLPWVSIHPGRGGPLNRVAVSQGRSWARIPRIEGSWVRIGRDFWPNPTHETSWISGHLRLWKIIYWLLCLHNNNNNIQKEEERTVRHWGRGWVGWPWPWLDKVESRSQSSSRIDDGEIGRSYWDLSIVRRTKTQRERERDSMPQSSVYGFLSYGPNDDGPP